MLFFGIRQHQQVCRFARCLFLALGVCSWAILTLCFPHLTVNSPVLFLPQASIKLFVSSRQTRSPKRCSSHLQYLAVLFPRHWYSILYQKCNRITRLFDTLSYIGLSFVVLVLFTSMFPKLCAVEDFQVCRNFFLNTWYLYKFQPKLSKCCREKMADNFDKDRVMLPEKVVISKRKKRWLLFSLSPVILLAISYMNRFMWLLSREICLTFLQCQQTKTFGKHWPTLYIV